MRVLRFLLPLAVLAICSGIAFITVANREEPELRAPAIAVTDVEVMPVARASYTVRLQTRGIVRPRTESTLIPEISGRIVEMSPRLRAGEFFEEGEVLLRIDDRDYEDDVVVAEAQLAQARVQLSEELARSQQARRDWDRLGERGTPDDLVLRKPQLAGARAAVQSAEARLRQARLDAERTRIRAPYSGRVLERNVDVGQYVSPGTVLARVYAVDYVEIRLPLTNRQLEFVDVPEWYPGDAAGAREPGPAVTLQARIGRRTHQWQGRVVRAEGSVDTQSRQLFVVAQVDDPYQKGPGGRPPLKIGQFVEAEIRGRTLEDVFVIPRSALRAGNEVLLVDSENRLRTRPVSLVWTDAENAVVSAGLAPGDRLVVTPLGSGMSGVEVRVRGAEPASPAAAAPGPGDDPGAGEGGKSS